MFKHPLDNPSAFKKNDTKHFADSLLMLSSQFEQGWHEASFIPLGFDPFKIRNVVLAGMGGSNLQGKIINGIAPFLLKVPFEIVANYRLPMYSDKNTLVIVTSYSGDTQETLSCFQDAVQKECQIICVSSGGELQRQAITNHVPLIILDSSLNPSGLPRTGIGFLLGSLLGVLTRLNPEAMKYLDSTRISEILNDATLKYQINSPQKKNPAKSLADSFKHQGIVLMASNHLTGVVETVQNVLNESAKTFAITREIPDATHHFLDGLVYPTKLKDHVSFLLLNSSLYPGLIERRFQTVKDILLKQKYRVTLIKPESSDPIHQVFESLVFLLWFSYYLSIVNKVDPSTTPWVNYLKNHL